MKLSKNMKIGLVVVAVIVVALLLYVGTGHSLFGQSVLWSE